MRSKSAQFLADAEAEYDPERPDREGPELWEFLPQPQDTEVARELAEGAESMHRPDEAELHHRNLLTHFGQGGPTLAEYARAHRALARLAAARGDLAEAERQARLALALDERPDVAARLADLLERRGRPEEAARLRERALAVAQARATRGLAAQAGAVERAAAFFGREPPAWKPEEVLALSRGPVRSSALEDPETGRPARGGLRCEALFGPRQAGACACGAQRGLDALGRTCRACGVEVLAASPRAVRLGHLALPRPVLHPHLRRGNPSLLARLMYQSQRQLESVRQGLALLVVDTPGPSLEYRPGEVLPLSDGPALRRMYGEDRLILGTGLEALVAHLRALDLEGLRAQLESALGQPLLPSNRARLESQLEAVRAIQDLRGGLGWACLEALPVLPPEAELASGPGPRARERAYARVLDASAALERLPPGADQERGLFALELQAAVDALFDLFD